MAYKIQLQNDLSAPGSNKVYGTDNLGNKGWFDKLELMEGATSTSDGKLGCVPAPITGDQSKVLFGDGTWKSIGSIHTHVASDITDLGTAALVNTGTGQGNIPVLDASGKLNAGMIPTEITVTSSNWSTFSASYVNSNTFNTASGNISSEKVCVGKPVRYKNTGEYKYGVITSATINGSNYDVTIAGVAISSDDTIFEIGNIPNLQILNLSVNGFFADEADEALLQNDMFTFLTWEYPKAHLSKISVIARVVDSGAANSNVNVKINSNKVLTSNSNAGLTVSNSWNKSITDIDSTNCIINYGDSIEISIDNYSTNKDAKDLTVQLAFVIE